MDVTSNSELILVEHWPVIVVLNGADHGDEAVARQYAELDRLYTSHPGPYAAVIDASTGGLPSPGQRKLVSDFSRRHEAHIARHCRGMAMVFSNPLMRGVMTAILWMVKKKAPQRVFTEVPEAVRWAQAQLAGAGIQPVPSIPAPGPCNTRDLVPEFEAVRQQLVRRPDADFTLLGVLSAADAMANDGNDVALDDLLAGHLDALSALASPAETPALSLRIEKLQQRRTG